LNRHARPPFAHERRGAADHGEYRYRLMPPLLVLGGLQHLAGLGVDKMNSPASGTRHGFVNFAICCEIGSNPALHLQISSWATVGNNHFPAIWETAPLDALLISANVLSA
jgi:hypothetical protein